MAKENKSYNINTEMATLDQLENELRRKKQEVTVHCSHVNAKGEHKLQYLNDRNDVMCKRCKKRFNLGEIRREELEAATNRVTDAIEQMRFISDPNQDYDLIEVLGRLSNNVSELPDSYERIQSTFSQTGRKKKNKNKNRGSSFGGFSSASTMSFLDGGNGGGKKNRSF